MPEALPTSVSGNVLLVVREPVLMDVLDDLLADHGFALTTTDSPHIIPDLCAASNFDVVVLDLDFPECIAGTLPVLLGKMQPANPHLGIVALATLPPPSDLLQSLPRLRNFLLKPFDPAWLARAVAQAAQDGALRREVEQHRAAAADAAEQARHLEQRLQDVQKKAYFVHLAGSLTHELKNLLSIIKVSASYGLRRGTETAADGKILKHLQIINEQVDRSHEQIIRFSRFAHGGDEIGAPSDVNAVVRDLLSLLDYSFGSANILVRQQLGDDLPAARAGEAALRHVLLNLLLNARDALPGGGGIALRTLLVAPGAGPPVIEVHVEDNGPGISTDMLEQVFEPFFTTKGDAQGTGLGLGIARRLAESFGGSLHALPREGGAHFVMRVPAADTGAGADAPPDNATVSATTGEGSSPAPAHSNSGRSNR